VSSFSAVSNLAARRRDVPAVLLTDGLCSCPHLRQLREPRPSSCLDWNIIANYLKNDTFVHVTDLRFVHPTATVGMVRRGSGLVLHPAPCLCVLNIPKELWANAFTAVAKPSAVLPVV
jgi:hypothetical protein